VPKTTVAERPPISLSEPRSLVQPTRSNLPRRRVARKKFSIPEEEQQQTAPIAPSSPSAITAATPSVSTSDASSCLQHVLRNLHVAFADAPAAASAATGFTHVVSILECAHPRGRPAVTYAPAHSFVDDAGVHRLHLGVRPHGPLSEEQLLLAGEFVASAGARGALVTAPGLRPGDAMAVVALCAAAEDSARTVEDVLKEVDENEEIMGFWKGVVDVEQCEGVEGVLKAFRERRASTTAPAQQ
jgi:hypothetical protein